MIQTLRLVAGAAIFLTVLVVPCASLSSSSSAVGAKNEAAGATISALSGLGKMLLSQNQKALDEGLRFPRTWVPLASVAELDPNRPTPIIFLNQHYVAYQDSSGQWVVADDACPHRLSPLSEGRIETIESGERLLQCAYHGWEFDSTGKCRQIPQMMDGSAKERALQDPRCQLKSYSTIVENNILWAWVWEGDPVERTVLDPSIAPERMLEGVAPASGTYTRDLPYGWDTLVENLIDPAHVPFAHHGLQGTREDAICINMTTPTIISKSGFELTLEDRTMGLMRKSKVTFRAPFTLIYTGEYDTDLPFRKYFDLTVLCIPTRPGWSRAIVMSARGRQDDISAKDGIPKKKRNKSLFAKLFGLVPTWGIHFLSNRFFNSDLVLLHQQEQEREKRGGDSGDEGSANSDNLYFMPAQADRAINAFRRWKNLYASVLLPVPPQIHTRAILFDHYSQHTDHCRHCQQGLKSLQTAQVRTKVVMAMGILFMAVMQKISVLGGVVVAGCIGFLHILKVLQDGFKTGDFRHYEKQ